MSGLLTLFILCTQVAVYSPANGLTLFHLCTVGGNTPDMLLCTNKGRAEEHKLVNRNLNRSCKRFVTKETYWINLSELKDTHNFHEQH